MSEQKFQVGDTRLPIDPAKLTVGEAFEYADTLGVWREWEIETADQLEKAKTPFGNRLQHIRAAQPPIDSLQPGDVVEVRWSSQSEVFRCCILSYEDGNGYRVQEVDDPTCGAPVSVLSSVNAWRLVYRAENVPQTKADPGPECTNCGQDIEEEENCGSRNEHGWQHIECPPRPFNWADLKPGEEFEIGVQVVKGGEYLPKLAAQVTHWRTATWHSDYFEIASGDWIGRRFRTPLNDYVGRWPVNKPAASHSDMGIARAGSAVSSKPANFVDIFNPLEQLRAGDEIDVFDGKKWLSAVVREKESFTFVGERQWRGLDQLRGAKVRLRGRVSRWTMSEKVSPPTERVIPWDGGDMGELKPGRVLRYGSADRRITAVKSRPWPCVEYVNETDGGCQGWQLLGDGVKDRRGWVRNNSVKLVEKIQPPPRWARYLNHGGDDD